MSNPNNNDTARVSATPRPAQGGRGWLDSSLKQELYAQPEGQNRGTNRQTPAANRQTASAPRQAELTGRTEPPRRKAGQQPARRRNGSLPPWVLVVVCLLYDAFLFHIWTEDSFSVGRFLTLVLLSTGFALLTALFATIGRSRKVHKICALVVVIFWAVMYLMEYFIYDSFKNFYTFSGIFTGAGNAGQEDFAARTFDLVVKNIWRILLYALPIVGWFLANRFLRLPRILTRGVRRYLAIAGAILMLVGLFFAAVISPDKRKMGESYDFTAAVHGFGLPMGFTLEAFSGGSAGDFDIEDNTEFTLPPMTEPTGGQQTAPPPATDSNGETLEPTTEPSEPQPPQKPYNMLDIDFDAILAGASSDSVKNVTTYLKSIAPSKTNEMTGMFKGKNLILITAEAFSGDFIDEKLTPTLYRMMTKGIRFTDYYQPAWGGSTSSGEFSVLTGIDPARGVSSIQRTINRNWDVTIGNILKDQGYFTRAYHDHNYDYYDRNKTHENLGYEKFIGLGNGMEEGVTRVWPESDKEMIDFTVPQYINNQPFSVYYMTVSGHGAYSWMGNKQSSRHKDEVADLPYSDTVKAYIACNLEVEYAMQSLIEQLEAAGIADDTVIVITADHYPYCLTKSDAWYTDKDYLSEYFGYTVKDCFGQDRNALIIWSGCLEDKNLVVDTPTFSLDIVPTLCNLFGVEYDSRLYCGRDVFSDQEPLVFWPNHSWKTDKGQWDASKSSGTEFTPAEGVEVTEEYLNQIRKTVSNKIKYSYQILDMDYFKLVFENVKQ